jgi:hypothetical protein
MELTQTPQGIIFHLTENNEEGYDVADKILEWRNAQRDYLRTSFIVFLDYKYESDDPWYTSNELLTIGPVFDSIIWDDDWWEGEKWIRLRGFTPIDDMTDPLIECTGGENNGD